MIRTMNMPSVVAIESGLRMRDAVMVGGLF
jgi:hypothetical protein